MDGNHSLLIVDDELAVRHFLKKVLEHDGYQVTAVESGEAALACAAVQEFHLAVVDLKLKGMSGIEVATRLKQRWPATSIIVLTAHASLETAVEALRQGAHDYLFKPCATEDLRESIRTGLHKRQQLLKQSAPVLPGDALSPEHTPEENRTAEPCKNQGKMPSDTRRDERLLRDGALIIDPVRHVVTLDGTPLELSPTEFGILAYLVDHAPRVIPPQELVRQVQGYESDTSEARGLIRSHIYHIRSKFKAATKRDVIRTVRGVGYSVRE